MNILKYTTGIVIAVAVIVLVLVFFGPCGNRKLNQENATLRAENKSLIAKKDKDSIQRINERIAENAHIAVVHAEAVAAIAGKEASDKKLTATKQRVAQLSAMITGRPVVPGAPIDTACMELAAQIPVLNQQINDYRTQADEAVELLNYEVLLRDSVIEKEVAYSDSLRTDFNRQSQLLKTALAVGRPRGKFLIGAGVMGNQEKLLGGASLKAAYLTKGGKMYQYSPHLLQLPGMTKAGLYHEASVLFNPFK